MNEYARLNISLGINVEIVSASRNTSAYKFGVILKINRKYRLAVLESFCPYLTINVLSLLRGEHKACVCICAYGHIVEIPHVSYARLYHFVIKFVARNSFVVAARVADRGAEKAAVLLSIFMAFIVVL